MSRDLKFRAWDGAKMVYDGDKVFPSHFDSKLRAVTGPAEVTNKGDNLWVYETQLKNATDRHFDHTSGIPVTEIMQFTGLHDKNGKEVFEGDVLRQEHYSDWIVAWYGTGFHVYVSCNPGTYYPLVQSDREIIGTIHENPELLKQEG